MNRKTTPKSTIEQLVRKRLQLEEKIKQQQKNRMTFEQLHLLQKLQNITTTKKNIPSTKTITLSLFLLLTIALSTILLLQTPSSNPNSNTFLTGAVTGIPLPQLAIKSEGVNDDLHSFLDKFDDDIDNIRYYNGTNNLIMLYTQNTHNTNQAILINGSISNTNGNATLTTLKNISLNVFNVSVTINLSDTSLTLGSNTKATATLGIINQTDFTKYFKCEVTLNNAGVYSLQIRNNAGPPKNTSSINTGAGTLRIEYNNISQTLSCEFDGSSISYPTTNVGEEYGFQLEGSLSGFSSPAGSINLTFDDFNYTATKRGPQCGILSSSATLAEDLETTSGNCFNITTSHITIDCAGHIISYGDDAIDLQLSQNQGNVTIKNCIFNQNIKNTPDSQAIRSYGGFFNNTFWNNTIYSHSNVGAITIWNNNNTNISWNVITQNGSYIGNGSGIDIQQSYNTWLDNNIVNTTAVQSNAITYTTGNTSIRNNRLNTISVNTNALGLNSLTQGTTVSDNTIITSANGGMGLSSTALQIMQSNNLLIRANKIKALGNFNNAFDLDTVNNSVIDNNTIQNNANGPFSGALGLLGITANNIFVNNNITAPQGGNEILDTMNEEPDTTYYNYLIYNNTWGEINWQNNGTGSFLYTMTLSVNGSLSLGETIFIDNNTAAINTSAFSPAQLINSSANITLRGLDLATVGQIAKVHNFTTNSTQIQHAGFDCNATGECSILSYIIIPSGGKLRFNTTSLGSFAGNLSSFTPPPPPPENTRPQPSPTLSPNNGSTTTTRTITFSWYNFTDADGDIFSYHLQLDDNPLFNNPEVNISALTPTNGEYNTTYTPLLILNVDKTYYWRVRANDSIGYGEWSNGALLDNGSPAQNFSNFTIISYLAITLTNSNISFGTQERGATISTETNPDDNILPFRAENIGNIHINVSLNATSFFSSVEMDTHYYQFFIKENESSSFDPSLSTMTWKNMSKIASQPHIVNLHWQEISNDFLVALNLTLPWDEIPGAKTSTVNFVISANE